MTKPIPMKFDCYIPKPARDIVLRRLFPIPEWDCLRAEWFVDHWEVSLIKNFSVVATLDYIKPIVELDVLITEAEALGCNVSKWRYLLKSLPLTASGKNLRS
jgi:hypothetical protein